MIRLKLSSRWRFLFLLLTGFFLVTPLSARQNGGSSESKIEVSSKLSVDKATAGSMFKVAVILKIAEGWHINSNTPTYDYLIGTSLAPIQREGVIVTDVRYPSGERTKFGFAEDSLSVYQGSPVIFFTVKLSDKVRPGKDTLRAKVEVQACNNQVCLAPASIDVTIPVELVGAS
jgi:DsbC/DsbD-like thiol-disulfide interchange protein